MQGFVAKTLVLGLIAAGFFMTGDLPWITDQIRNWSQGQSPASPEGNLQPAEATFQAMGPAVSPQETPASQATPETAPLPPRDSAVPVPQTELVTLPKMTAQKVHLGQLQPGDRILVRTEYEIVAYDLIDPNVGDAIEHRHAIVGSDAAAAAALAAPRRVLLPTELSVGQSLMLSPLSSILNGNTEPTGVVSALAVEKPLM